MKNIRIFSVIALLLYILIRFVFDAPISRIWDYASYVFEGVFVIVLSFVYWRYHLWIGKCRRFDWSALPAFGLAGFVIYMGTGLIGLPVPFDLSSSVTLLFLLVIGPVLEELLFRFVLWDAVLVLSSPRVTYLSMCAFFSLAHFVAYFAVPPEFKGFVLYQSMYTLALAIGCGWYRLRTNGILLPILAHGLFNAGFYLGHLIKH